MYRIFCIRQMLLQYMWKYPIALVFLFVRYPNQLQSRHHFSPQCQRKEWNIWILSLQSLKLQINRLRALSYSCKILLIFMTIMKNILGFSFLWQKIGAILEISGTNLIVTSYMKTKQSIYLHNYLIINNFNG